MVRGVKLLCVRRYSVARENRGDRFAKDEDRKRSEEGLRAGSSRRREQDGRDHPDRQDHEPIRVPKKREEARVERIPVEEGQAPEEIEVRDDEVLIPVTEEEIVVERREVVKEVLRVRKDVVEDEEVVSVDDHENSEPRHNLDERAQRGPSAKDRRGTAGAEKGAEKDRGQVAKRRRPGRDRGEDTSFIDKAKEALSGGDTRGEEGTRTRREDEPPRRSSRR